jgi:ribonuclease J
MGQSVRVKIHRGTAEIGGTCVELAANGGRILLDLGLPLDGDADDETCYPKIEGLAGDGDLLGLVLSHGHVDHWGLAPLAGPKLPVYLGAATHRILKAAAPFVPRPYVPADAREYESGVSFDIGPFRITPHLTDHSAYDAYSIEVEADGQRLFYSGDIRGHGRKAALFERLISKPPRNIDVMLMEGSTLGRLDPDHTFPTEAEVEALFVERFQQTQGLVLVAASAQNIDRMVSLYRACKRTGRTLLIDLYAAEVLRATGNPHIPQSDWPNVALYVPQYQRVRIKKTERFDLLDAHKTQRVFNEDLASLAPKAVLLFRHAMLADLDKAGCLQGAHAVWSQWDGYLKNPSGHDLLAALAERHISLSEAHTSGHASIIDLKRLAAAIAPKALVPIHTFEAKRFPEYFSDVVLKQDGEWWEVAA